MSHLDEDLIAELALGDASDEAHRLHLESCQVCAERVRELEATLATVKGLRQPAELLTPPERVWQSIQAEVATDQAGGDELSAMRARKRRTPVSMLVASAAAAGAIIGGVGVAAIMDSGTVDADPPVVASAELIDLGSDTPVGAATVHTLPDGSAILVLDVPVQPVDGAALEVWLIDQNVEGMISLGHLTADNTTFVIPTGFEYSDFPIVDISVEPFDGDPTHSGDSIHRGVLDA